MTRNQVAITLAAISTIFFVALAFALWLFFFRNSQAYCNGHPEHASMYECQYLNGNDE